MGKMRLKRYRLKLSRKNKFIFFCIVLLVILIFAITLIKMASQRIMPDMLEYAKIKTTSFASIVITKSVQDEIDKNFKEENLFLKEGNTDNINFNPVEVNKLLNSLTTNVNKNISILESGEIEKLNLTEESLKDYNTEELKKGIISRIPLGIIFNSTFLANLSPKIPVKLKFIGGVNTDIETDVSSYGINNALIKVNVKISVDAQVALPFTSETTTVVTKVPLVLKLIQGEVPEMYYPQLDSRTQK